MDASSVLAKLFGVSFLDLYQQDIKLIIFYCLSDERILEIIILSNQ